MNNAGFSDTEGPGRTVVLQDGSSVVLRPLRLEDREREQAFIRRLSPESRRARFLGGMREASESLLDALMTTDGAANVAVVAIVTEEGGSREVGIGRYAATSRPHECECAVAVADEWRHRGLDTVLMRELIATAGRKRFETMISVDLMGDREMEALAASLGFERRPDPMDSTLVIHTLHL